MRNDTKIFVYGPPLAPPVELSRWLLDRFSIPHRFEAAAAGISAIRSTREKVSIEPPLLHWKGEASGGLRSSFDRVTGPIADAHFVTVPAFDTAIVTELMANLLGPAVRTFYRYMLPRPDLLKPLATAGLPFLHQIVIQLAYPGWRWVMAKGLKLAEHDTRADVAIIQRCFAEVESRLGDSRFLSGDHPGIDDLVFAALASPVLLPPEHPVRLPPVETLPEQLRAIITRFRLSSAGDLALRIYAADRGPS